MNLDMRTLADYYARLAPRERVLLAVAVPTLVGMIVYSMIWVPLQEQRTMLQRQVVQRSGNYAKCNNSATSTSTCSAAWKPTTPPLPKGINNLTSSPISKIPSARR